MSGLIPFRHPFWHGSDYWDWPPVSRIFDQRFAMEPMWDLLTEPLTDSFRVSPYWARMRPVEGEGRSGISEVKNEADKFTVSMDVSQFLPQEIKVKVVENMVVVDGKHDEKMDQHGFVSRAFTRKYILPKEVDPQTVVSRLSPKGVLTIEAPKKAIEGAPKERTVPIQMAPEKPAVEQKKVAK
ncbi:unnamed protein product [Soboliphyme baturini]|uniref:SHSP domain-containing protein n=1 Tax=Soboliphyme baturini TaxID=241478 RepID=A0A183IZT7_9BILA|nr:unnamed protein product [Soboliphyme baturini]